MLQKITNYYRDTPVQFRASFWFLVTSVLQSGLNIFTLPLFTRLLSPEQYGLSSTYFAWNDIVSIACTLRFSYGVFDKGMVKYKLEKDQFESALLGLSMSVTCVMGALMILTFNITNRYSGLTLGLYCLMIAYQMVSPALLFWTNRSKFDYKYKTYSLVAIGTSVVCTIVNLIAVIFISADKGIVKVVSYHLVWITVNVFVSFYIYAKGKVFYRKDIWKYALSYNLPLLPYFFSTVILDKSDRVMISNICGDSSVAFYSVSYSLANLMILFTSAIGGTFTPWIFRKLDRKDYRDISKITNMIIIIFMVLSFVFMLFAPELIGLFASSEYSEAIYVIPPVVASNFFILLYSLVSKMEYYYEKTKTVAAISIITAIVNIGLNYLFIPMYGYIAAAYTTLISYMLSTLLHCLTAEQIRHKEYIKERIYSWSHIVIFSLIIMCVTIGINAIYSWVIIRWSIVIAMCIVVVLLRHKILDLVKVIKGEDNEEKF